MLHQSYTTLDLAANPDYIWSLAQDGGTTKDGMDHCKQFKFIVLEFGMQLYQYPWIKHIKYYKILIPIIYPEPTNMLRYPAFSGSSKWAHKPQHFISSNIMTHTDNICNNKKNHIGSLYTARILIKSWDQVS